MRAACAPLQRQLSLSVLSGVIVTNPVIRRQYRQLLLKHTDFSLFRVLNEIISDTRMYPDKRQWLPLFDEVLLRAAMKGGKLALAPSTARFAGIALQPGEEEMSATLRTALEFERDANTASFDTCLEDLIELAYADMRIAYRLWVELFPVVWSTLIASQQCALTEALSRFLASDIHFIQQGVSPHLMWEELDRDFKQWHVPTSLPYAMQANSRYGSIPCTNGTQALLEGVLRAVPQPRLAPVLLLNLAKTYGCGPQASLLLESGLRDCVDAKERKVYQRCLQQVYLELKEEDAAASMITSLPYPELHNGMVLERFGKYQTAQIAYLEGLRNQEVVNSIDALMTVKARWKECAMNLKQWIPLFEYGKLNRDIVLLLECYGKCNIWDSYPKLYLSSVLSVEGDLAKPRAQLLYDKWSIIQCIQNGSIKYRSHLSEILIKNYRALPYQPVLEYDHLLHLLYQNNDITFSTLLMSCNPQKGFTNEVISILKPFNSYTMNNWDPLSMCEDILIWRSNLFSQFCQRVPADLPRSPISPHFYQIMLSRAARYLGLPEVAVEYLSSMPDSTSVLESLDKWKEKVMVMIDLGIHDPSVLTELDHYQLDSLTEGQKSTLFYTKGVYCSKEKRYDDAINFFMRAVKDDNKSDSKNAKAWDGWGGLLYQRWKERGDINDAKQCLLCCCQQLISNNEMAKAMSRFVHIAFTLSDVATIVNRVATVVQRIPLMNWFNFLPFIFSRPTETQFAMMMGVVKELIAKYPQIAFYPLLTLCQSLGLKEESLYARQTVPVDAIEGEKAAKGGSDKTVSFQVGDESWNHVQTVLMLYKTLLARPSTTPGQLQLFVDLLHRVPHSPLRELLFSLDRVLQAVQADIAALGFQGLTQRVGPEIQERLKNICAVSFNPANAVPSTIGFIRLYGPSFLSDFAPLLPDAETPNPAFPTTLQELLERLLLWKQLVLKKVDEEREDALFEEFHLYSRLMPGCIQVPGQQINTTQASQACPTIHTLRVHRPALYTEHHGWRYVDLVNERNQVYRFYLQQLSATEAVVEERSLALQVFFDVITVASQPVQMRHLRSSLPSYVSVSPTLRLVRAPVFGSTLEGVYRSVLGEAYDEKQVEFALKLFVLNHPQSAVPDAYVAWAKEVAKERVFEEVCDDCLLTQFMWS